MKPPQRRCRCSQAYQLCAACRAWQARSRAGTHHLYRGILRRTWATPQDIREISRLRQLGYQWVQIVALLGITSGALRAVRRLGLVPAKAEGEA